MNDNKNGAAPKQYLPGLWWFTYAADGPLPLQEGSKMNHQPMKEPSGLIRYQLQTQMDRDRRWQIQRRREFVETVVGVLAVAALFCVMGWLGARCFGGAV